VERRQNSIYNVNAQQTFDEWLSSMAPPSGGNGRMHDVKEIDGGRIIGLEKKGKKT
jgi:hypothetical protein